MARAQRLTEVQCYHCRTQLEIGARAMTVSSPKCAKRVVIEDIVIKTAHGVTKLQTCGSITIEKRGRVNAKLVEAHKGLTVEGIINADAHIGGHVRIGPKATWKGACRAPTITIEAGAKVEGGHFAIAGDGAGDADGLPALPGVRAAPG